MAMSSEDIEKARIEELFEQFIGLCLAERDKSPQSRTRPKSEEKKSQQQPDEISLVAKVSASQSPISEPAAGSPMDEPATSGSANELTSDQSPTETVPTTSPASPTHESLSAQSLSDSASSRSTSDSKYDETKSDKKSIALEPSLSLDSRGSELKEQNYQDLAAFVKIHQKDIGKILSTFRNIEGAERSGLLIAASVLDLEAFNELLKMASKDEISTGLHHRLLSGLITGDPSLDQDFYQKLQASLAGSIFNESLFSLIKIVEIINTASRKMVMETYVWINDDEYGTNELFAKDFGWVCEQVNKTLVFYLLYLHKEGLLPIPTENLLQPNLEMRTLIRNLAIEIEDKSQYGRALYTMQVAKTVRNGSGGLIDYFNRAYANIFQYAPLDLIADRCGSRQVLRLPQLSEYSPLYKRPWLYQLLCREPYDLIESLFNNPTVELVDALAKAKKNNEALFRLKSKSFTTETNKNRELTKDQRKVIATLYKNLKLLMLSPEKLKEKLNKNRNEFKNRLNFFIKFMKQNISTTDITNHGHWIDWLGSYINYMKEAGLSKGANKAKYDYLCMMRGFLYLSRFNLSDDERAKLVAKSGKFLEIKAEKEGKDSDRALETQSDVKEQKTQTPQQDSSFYEDYANAMRYFLELDPKNKIDLPNMREIHFEIAMHLAGISNDLLRICKIPYTQYDCLSKAIMHCERALELGNSGAASLLTNLRGSLAKALEQETSDQASQEEGLAEDRSEQKTHGTAAVSLTIEHKEVIPGFLQGNSLFFQDPKGRFLQPTLGKIIHEEFKNFASRLDNAIDEFSKTKFKTTFSSSGKSKPDRSVAYLLETTKKLLLLPEPTTKSKLEDYRKRIEENLHQLEMKLSTIKQEILKKPSFPFQSVSAEAVKAAQYIDQMLDFIGMYRRTAEQAVTPQPSLEISDEKQNIAAFTQQLYKSISNLGKASRSIQELVKAFSAANEAEIVAVNISKEFEKARKEFENARNLFDLLNEESAFQALVQSSIAADIKNLGEALTPFRERFHEAYLAADAAKHIAEQAGLAAQKAQEEAQLANESKHTDAIAKADIAIIAEQKAKEANARYENCAQDRDRSAQELSNQMSKSGVSKLIKEKGKFAALANLDRFESEAKSNLQKLQEQAKVAEEKYGDLKKAYNDKAKKISLEMSHHIIIASSQIAAPNSLMQVLADGVAKLNLLKAELKKNESPENIKKLSTAVNELMDDIKMAFRKLNLPDINDKLYELAITMGLPEGNPDRAAAIQALPFISDLTTMQFALDELIKLSSKDVLADQQRSDFKSLGLQR